MRQPHHDIVPRDDNLFDVVVGDVVAGPFPTIAFAMKVASGDKPAPVMPAHRFRIARREVLHVTP